MNPYQTLDLAVTKPNPTLNPSQPLNAKPL